MRALVGIFFICTLIGCASGSKPTDSELEKVAELMTGTFSSAAQAEADSAFYNINLVMHPIWDQDQDYKWLYVEQAVTAMLDKPYRQRVYRLSKTEEGTIESKVFELPEPSRFIHGWNDSALFDQINPDSLIARVGCAVFLTKTQDGCYEGSTDGKKCGSTLRGASYATSEVVVCSNSIASWDRGWDDQDEHVWGAEKSGYIFDKTSNTSQ